MIHINGRCGKYPAISITGKSCQLNCLHCKASLLKNMIACNRPEELEGIIKGLEKRNMIGVLLSGGCDAQGRLPWDKYLPVIKNLDTSLFISAHAGMNVDIETAKAIKSAGIKQALIDVVVDTETIRDVYNIDNPNIVHKTIDNLFTYGPRIVPHLIVGIGKGKIKGEYEAIDFLTAYKVPLLVLVVLMPINKTLTPPPIDEVLDVFRYARRKFPKIALGCAKPRGSYRYELEKRLIAENLIDNLAVWSDAAIAEAKQKGKKINYHYTCCSVPPDEV